MSLSFEMFRPVAFNALGREFKPGRPINNETRRRIINLYLIGEGPNAISRAVRVTHGAVSGVVRRFETFSTYDAYSQGGRRNSSKLSDDILECIELFKLMKPSVHGW